jgi:hypothetical protein
MRGRATQLYSRVADSVLKLRSDVIGHGATTISVANNRRHCDSSHFTGIVR